MKFLFLTQYFHPEVGAAQIRLAAVARQLLALGHQVEVVTALPNHPTGRVFSEYRGRYFLRDQWGGVPVLRTWVYAATGGGTRRIANYLSFTLTSLLGLAKSSSCDYLFVESPPLFLGFSAAITSLYRQIPFIFNVADLWPDSIRDLGVLENRFLLGAAERLERWAYRRARYVTAVTEGIRSVLTDKKGVPKEKVLFLPNGVDTELFRPRPYDGGLAREFGIDSRPVVLYAGTLGFAHGADVAVEASSLPQGQRLNWVFIGDGSEKWRLVERARELRLSNVFFLNPAPPEEVARLFSIAAVGLSTLRSSPLFEGTRPVKMLAAMASGKAVLYAGAGEGARLLEQANAGIVTPPEDAASLAMAASQLAESVDLAASLGENGRRYALEHFSWRRIVEDWLNELVTREKQRGRSSG